MYCEYCGTPIEPGAKFCGSCGQPVPLQRKPGGKSFTTVLPAVICLISAIFFSLISVGVVIYTIVAANKFNSYASYLSVNLYSLGGGFLILFEIALLLAVFLPVILVNYRAYRGLWKGEASGYQWGLLASFYGLVFFLTVYSSFSPSWAQMLPLVFPLISAVCLLIDDNLSKLTKNPISVVMPAFLSLTFFCVILHILIISAVSLLFPLVATSSLQPYLRMLMSMSSEFSNQTTQLAIVVVLAVIIIAALLVMFYRAYRGLLELWPNAYIGGIIVFVLLTLAMIAGYASNRDINFWGVVLAGICAIQVVLLLLTSTRRLFSYRPSPNPY